MEEIVADVVIVGGGPAGLTAGIYTSRSRLSTILIEKVTIGGQAAITDIIENYPGFPDGINGFELSQLMMQQAEKFGTDIRYEEVEMAWSDENWKFVQTDQNLYKAKALIVATGASPKKLGVPGEKEFMGRGVSYCATCDGAFFKGKRVAVIGGGDSAVEEAVYLTRFASEVFIVHRRDKLRATAILQERAKANPKIKFVWNSVVKEIKGNKSVEGIHLVNRVDGSESFLEVDGVFVFIGLMPETGFIGEVDKDDAGYIITDVEMRTSVEGIFAAGDCRKKLLRQVSTAVGDGATAAYAAEKYIEEKWGD